MSATSPLPRSSVITAEELLAGTDICVQCGVCLSVCPTYALTGLEVQSPRGRVMLYRAAMEGLTSDDAPVLQAAYDCLDCRACQTVCPSNVKPGELALEARVGLQGGRAHGPVVKGMLFAFEHAWMLDLANWGVRVYQRLGLQGWVRRSKVLERMGGLGRTLAGVESLLPARPVAPALRTRVALETPAQGEARGRVAFFLGCVMNAVLSDASSATVEVLTRNGFAVVTPRETTCCGAPHIEEGELEGYRRVARRNVEL
ncbi:MAG TPA: (Fe-S)-binding protein, partial [Deinococcales bacterium]|nr:(Fe-S)-binding protein [Deinococcales bacterium]